MKQFKDRLEAARLLVKKLEKYKDEHPLILGIPRGAIPMAKILSDSLNGELSAILVHKIPAPNNPEFAIGSVGLSGKIWLQPYIQSLQIPEEYIENASEQELKVLKQRQLNYGLKPLVCRDRIVIIVDDGIATGSTVLASIKEISLYHPKKIVVATPVASLESVEKLKPMVDELVVLLIPENFYAVGQFYAGFSQVTDDEVIEILDKNSPGD